MPPAETSRQLKGLPTCGGSNNGGVPSEPENLPCPRCESTNTKFCYYNNYNLSQPRYFCKSCRRYWTRGGSLRNIPVGGGTRKKHSSSSCKRARNKNSVTTEQPTHEQQYRKVEEEVEDKKKAAAAEVVTTSTTIPCGELVPQQHSTVTTSTATRMYGNMAAVPFPLEIKAERSEMNLNERASNTTTSAAVTMAPVSFTSLLGGGGMFHPQHQEGIGGFGGFLGLSGWGLGLNGSASSGLGFDGLGFGIGGPVGKEEWGDVLGVGGGGEIECKGEEINNEAVCDGGGGGRSSGGSSSGCNTWQFGGGGGGGLNGEDCFVWSDLAMSTPGTGLE